MNVAPRADKWNCVPPLAKMENYLSSQCLAHSLFFKRCCQIAKSLTKRDKDDNIEPEPRSRVFGRSYHCIF